MVGRMKCHHRLEFQYDKSWTLWVLITIYHTSIILNSTCISFSEDNIYQCPPIPSPCPTIHWHLSRESVSTHPPPILSLTMIVATARWSLRREPPTHCTSTSMLMWVS